jgi:hypothetical protein
VLVSDADGLLPEADGAADIESLPLDSFVENSIQPVRRKYKRQKRGIAVPILPDGMSRTCLAASARKFERVRNALGLAASVALAFDPHKKPAAGS